MFPRTAWTGAKLRSSSRTLAPSSPGVQDQIGIGEEGVTHQRRRRPPRGRCVFDRTATCVMLRRDSEVVKLRNAAATVGECAPCVALYLARRVVLWEYVSVGEEAFVNDGFERRLTRAGALRLLLRAPPGLRSVSVPQSRAGRGSGRRGRRPGLPRVTVAGRPQPRFVPVRRRRAHTLALDGARLRAAERSSARRDVGRAAQARACSVALEQLARRLPQGARHHGFAGGAAAHEHGRRRSLRSEPLLRLRVRDSGARAWGWRFEGHHLSRHFTVVDGRLVTEPFFLGAWPTRAGARIARSGRATGRCRARKTQPGRSPIARRPAAEAGVALVGVADRPRHAERRPGRAARPGRRACGRAPVSRAEKGARDRADISREPPAGAGARRARADRASRHRPHALRLGGKHPPRRSLSTTGCKGRPSSSSSTTPGTAAPTSTASGATSTRFGRHLL